MSYRKLFWGVILIIIGVLFILKNLGLVFFNWSVILSLWPLLLILWGISIIPVNALIRLGLSVAAIIMAFLLVDSDAYQQKHHFRWNDDHFHFDWDDEDNRRGSKEENTLEWEDTQELSANYENTKYASLEFDAGAGSFTIDKITRDHLALFHKKGKASQYSLKTRTEENRQYVAFKLKNQRVSIPDNNKDKNNNIVEARLHPDPIWDFDFNIGAAEIDFDLSDFKIETMKIDGGAADVEIKLGQKHKKTLVRINAGASDIKIKIPRSAGARINTSSILTGKNFDEGFSKSNGDFITENYESAANVIDIKVQAAIANLTVERY